MEHDAVSSDSADDRPADMYSGFVPCPPEDVTGMDIFGVCSSRDALGIPADFLGGNGRIKINRYLRGISFVAIFDPHRGPVAEPDDFRSIPLEFYRHESAVKNSLADFNKTSLQDLSASGSEWLMVDGICMSRGVRRITYSDGSTELISNFIGRHVYGVKKVLGKKGVPFKMETITEIDVDLYEERFSMFTDFVLRRYGDKIILNCACASDGYLDKDGEYRQWSPDPRKNLEA
ncbi:MAG: hypothetical protein IKQ60_03680 [Candidatus Methanomethylophilaceae archaeon]|nr:hypothetical protein [Candidatus Methanomethylophilaceae archaeon]